MTKISVGTKFNRLTVLGTYTESKKYKAICVCDCGKFTTVFRSNLTRGHTKSCGCLSVEVYREREIIHGHKPFGKPSKTYNSWRGIIDRCLNKNSTTYYKYGAKGITVCDRWKTFSNFLEDMGERPEGKSIDRIDNFKGYELKNCRWATNLEQAHNKRPKVKMTYDDTTSVV